MTCRVTNAPVPRKVNPRPRKGNQSVMTHSPSTRRRARRLGGVVAGTLALGLIPLAGPASAATELPEQRNIRENACPATPLTGAITSTEVPEDGFTDAGSSLHAAGIGSVAKAGITTGCAADR